MASPEKRTPQNERSVTRIYRAAVRLGEDFITLEESVTLPIDATDDEVAQAVDLGWRIYRAQRTAVEAQVVSIRETAAVTATNYTVKDPDAPASDKQRNYIAALQEDLVWSSEQLASYAHEQQIDLVTLTKGQASGFIDGLKKLAEERSEYERTKVEAVPAVAPAPAPAPAPRTARPNDSGPAVEKQIQALERLAQHKGLELDAESRRRYGTAAHGLTFGQAGELLSEWQRRP
jgi:hypothetical protein